MLNEKETNELNKIWRDVNETSDFPKWQNSRRTAGLSMDFASWEKARDAALARQKAHADEGQRKHHAELERMRLADQAKADAEIELELAADKRRLQNQWLVDHPGKTEADFNQQAWHLLKSNLIAERDAAQMEVEMRNARMSMDFI
jgi:hypothetical protein